MIAALAGLICGVLSGLGIGGGTLLMVYMTAMAGIGQTVAQGINLLYFLPTAACALFLHAKNRLLHLRVIVPAAIGGCVCAVGAALLATAIDTELLRRLFGGFLLIVGVKEVFYRDKNAK